MSLMARMSVKYIFHNSSWNSLKQQCITIHLMKYTKHLLCIRQSKSSWEWIISCKNWNVLSSKERKYVLLLHYLTLFSPLDNFLNDCSKRKDVGEELEFGWHFTIFFWLRIFALGYLQSKVLLFYLIWNVKRHGSIFP